MATQKTKETDKTGHEKIDLLISTLKDLANALNKEEAKQANPTVNI